MDDHVPLIEPGCIRAVFPWPFIEPRCWLVYSESHSSPLRNASVFEYDGAFPTEQEALARKPTP